MNALLPTPEQLANGWFFTCLLLGVFAVLVAVWWASEHAIDGILRLVHRRRRATVVDFAERRRMNAVVAIRGDR